MVGVWRSKGSGFVSRRLACSREPSASVYVVAATRVGVHEYRNMALRLVFYHHTLPTYALRGSSASQILNSYSYAFIQKLPCAGSYRHRSILRVRRHLNGSPGSRRGTCGTTGGLFVWAVIGTSLYHDAAFTNSVHLKLQPRRTDADQSMVKPSSSQTHSIIEHPHPDAGSVARATGPFGVCFRESLSTP